MTFVKPFRPQKIGFLGFINNMPPPSLFYELFDQYTIIAFLDIGPKN